ncbi:MAG: carbamate kinase [Actinomycetota bacterium]
MRVVVALGGNAITRAGQRGTIDEMRSAINDATTLLASMHRSGMQLIITHGNGPQVGRLLVQNIATERRIAPMPLDVLGSESQAEIGYLLQQSLGAAIAPTPVVTLVTQTLVDATDSAFQTPSKPIGPYMLAPAARALEARGFPVARDEIRGGYRRVVASPKPLRFVEQAAIAALLDAGVVPIVAGGGGVPVVREGSRLVGVEAVIDKDLAAAVLTRELKASLLVILTDVEHVVVARGTESERSVGSMSIAQAKEFLERGEFPAGSMGPKVQAAIEAVVSGARAIITSLEAANDALAGQAGTEITR